MLSESDRDELRKLCHVSHPELKAWRLQDLASLALAEVERLHEIGQHGCDCSTEDASPLVCPCEEALTIRETVWSLMQNIWQLWRQIF